MAGASLRKCNGCLKKLVRKQRPTSTHHTAQKDEKRREWVEVEVLHEERAKQPDSRHDTVLSN